jgi:hypothetical protein
MPVGSKWNVHIVDWDKRTKDTTAEVTSLKDGTVTMDIAAWRDGVRRLELRMEEGKLNLVKIDAVGPKSNGEPQYPRVPKGIAGKLEEKTIKLTGQCESYLPEGGFQGAGAVELTFTRQE